MLALCIPMASASATVSYNFKVSNLMLQQGKTAADFSIVITEPNYLTSTGLSALPAALPTTLGYNVVNFGTNNSGWFGFSQSGGNLTDFGFVFSDTSFIFQSSSLSSYVTAPGVFAGGISGDAPYYFTGTGVLTVTNSSVPEPTTWAMMVCGFGFLGAAVRRRTRAAAVTYA